MDLKNVKVIHDGEEYQRVKGKVAKLLQWNRGGFPGNSPVPLDGENLNLLNIKDFVVSPKWDGTRYLLFFENLDHCYLIGRNNDVLQVMNPPHLNSHPCDNDSMEMDVIGDTNNFKDEDLTNTVLDGEMMEYRHKDGTITQEYHVFDVIVFKGHATAVDLRHRQKLLMDRILKKHGQSLEFRSSCRHLPGKESFAVRFSPCYPLQDTGRLIRSMNNQTALKHDGLIFTDTTKPYNYYPKVPGINTHILKWKPGSKNTVDFRLLFETGAQPCENGSVIPLGNLFVSDSVIPVGTIKLTKELVHLNGEIIECNLTTANEWVLYRHRKDKSEPNTINVYQCTLKSITARVSEADLLAHIAKISQSTS